MTSLRGAWRIRLGLGALATLAYASAARSDDDVDVLAMNAGLGLSFPTNDAVGDGTGKGGWLAVEYAYRDIAWISPRSYAGGIITVPARNCGPMVSPCEVSSKLFFFGAKIRFQIPIPYVAPYLESGTGISVGTLTTRIGGQVSRAEDGVMFHVPFGLGLAFGPKHQYDLSLQYLFHPWAAQVDGALAFGLSFPLAH